MSESKQNWSIPIEGVIHVPNELDPLINSIGFQYRLHTISRRFSEPEFICRAVYAAEQFFTEKHSADLEQLRKENERLKEEGKQSLLLYNSMTKNIEQLQRENDSLQEKHSELFQMHVETKVYATLLQGENTKYLQALEEIINNRRMNYSDIKSVAKQALNNPIVNKGLNK